MKYTFSMILGLTVLFISSAQAFGASRSGSDELTYEVIRYYQDGIAVVESPKLYSLFVSGFQDEATTNGDVVCQKLGMAFIQAFATSTSDAPVPAVSYGADMKPVFLNSLAVISKVVCRL